MDSGMSHCEHFIWGSPRISQHSRGAAVCPRSPSVRERERDPLIQNLALIPVVCEMVRLWTCSVNVAWWDQLPVQLTLQLGDSPGETRSTEKGRDCLGDVEMGLKRVDRQTDTERVRPPPSSPSLWMPPSGSKWILRSWWNEPGGLGAPYDSSLLEAGLSCHDWGLLAWARRKSSATCSYPLSLEYMVQRIICCFYFF